MGMTRMPMFTRDADGAVLTMDSSQESLRATICTESQYTTIQHCYKVGDERTEHKPRMPGSKAASPANVHRFRWRQGAVEFALGCPELRRDYGQVSPLQAISQNANSQRLLVTNASSTRSRIAGGKPSHTASTASRDHSPSSRNSLLVYISIQAR